EFAVRYLNELIRGVRHTFPDMRFIVHICGQMKNVFSELTAVEADAFSFDAMVNLRTAREHLAPRKVMGNVSSFGLAFASEEKVQAMARAALNMGSDILAPACGLGTRSDIRSVQALLRAARRNRKEEDALLCTI
ncbi:uroporphyrinogen decarboxylase family protein, partial [uncultured Fretibacterium sp.]|uniref:uroporphyrinogen decarboxylase family protein n=1 Tax=uncultured Fretibacterium sp. TaxID=1678694 RepID=UPI0026275B53